MFRASDSPLKVVRSKKKHKRKKRSASAKKEAQAQKKEAQAQKKKRKRNKRSVSAIKFLLIEVNYGKAMIRDLLGRHPGFDSWKQRFAEGKSLILGSKVLPNK
jgi:hypothetical protein